MHIRYNLLLLAGLLMAGIHSPQSSCAQAPQPIRTEEDGQQHSHSAAPAASQLIDPQLFAPQPVGKQPEGRPSVKDVLSPALSPFPADSLPEGPHQQQARVHPLPQFRGVTALPARRSSGPLTHVVHGYHPYWIPDAAADLYRWDLLTHLAYFSYEVDPATGEPATVHGWATSTVIDRAKAEGVKVLLTVTNFGAANNRTFLSSTSARDLLITRLTALLLERGGSGVNIDFEGLPGDQRENLVSFFAELRNRLDAAIPDAVISVAAPAVDWNGAWDVAALSNSIDLFFVMCYDYSWSGSSTAGPVAPIRGMTYNVDRTLRWYLDQGVPPGRLLMGVPYYGYDWSVTGNAQGAATTGKGVARTYSAAAGMLPSRTRQWSESFLNPWIIYQTSGWQQLWYDDAQSLEFKYQLVKDLGIAGIGMWALGYDADLPELWMLIERMFTRPASVQAFAAADAFSVWPHPLRGGEQAVLQLKEGRAMQIQNTAAGLYDLLGRKIADPALEIISDRMVRIVVPRVPAGVYMLVSGGVNTRIVISE